MSEPFTVPGQFAVAFTIEELKGVFESLTLALRSVHTREEMERVADSLKVIAEKILKLEKARTA